MIEEGAVDHVGYAVSYGIRLRSASVAVNDRDTDFVALTKWHLN